jgi:hypothetical protein
VHRPSDISRSGVGVGVLLFSSRELRGLADTDVASRPSIEGLLKRIRSEYLEMPGLCLTDAQASRLWGLDGPTCQRVLCALLEGGFLRRTADGRFARAN